MSKGLAIVGSSRANGDREDNDFYPTPPEAVESLLERETFTGNIWECACGDGAISEVLKAHSYEVLSSDLINRGYGEQRDFLFGSHNEINNIITNPPYKYAVEFVEKAKTCTTDKIAMFLKTVFLEGSSRYEMFQDKQFPLARIYQFSKRVTLSKNGIKLKNSGMIAYAWFVWDKNYKGEAPQIYWINN